MKERPMREISIIIQMLLAAGIGTVLDIMLGYHFFQFPNQEATLGLRIPAWNWSDMSFVRSYLPVEEFGFYILGAIFMASIYLWAGQHWLSEYERKDYDLAAKAKSKMIRLRQRHLGSVPRCALRVVDVS